ncbi:MAG: lytic transglycosylase domain-containing protein [Endomicrobiaceae bacterium]|nr:lytic transglycosylase domain-containing protein [Endomicrobiaceae bacterium]MDD3922029.1 lytic transglycosylase domain-containing protein [Endomicrobiaceae bacterium]
MRISVGKLIGFILLGILLIVYVYLYIHINNISKYSDIVTKYSIQYNIDPLLVKAVIKAESNFNPLAKSKKGAIGLMQLMPSTGKEVAAYLGYKDFKEDRLYEPEVNIMLGTYYLKILSAMFNNNTNLVLASYNAGLGHVRQWHQENPFIEYDSEEMPVTETKRYVSKINRIYTILKLIDNNKFIRYLSENE